MHGTDSARVFIAGRSGLVGSAVYRHLAREGFTDLVGPTSAELELRERRAVFAWFADGRVGGVKANATRPAEFPSDNLRIQGNVLDAALKHGVERLLWGPTRRQMNHTMGD